MATAIITGGSRGLGRALAMDLARDGWSVVIDGRDAESLRTAADDIGPAATAVPGDVTDPAHRAHLVAAARETGGLDLLVNNASDLGPSPLPPLASLPLEALSRLFDVNVVAPLGLVQVALPLLAADGAIINVSSDAAIEPYEGWGGYGATKAALDQLSHVLAAEHPGLSVWWVDPGDMRTQMHQDAFPGQDISDRPEPETVVPAFRRLLDERPPSGRVRAAELSPEPAP